MTKRTRAISDHPLAVLPIVAVVAAFVATSAATASAAELLAGVGPKNKLVLFSSDDPSDVDVKPITGLFASERIVGLDVRPATGELYGLGRSSRLYRIDPDTGAATLVSRTPFSPALAGTEFGFDFNPTVDRIRIVSDTEQNLRVHPDTGVLVSSDMPLVYTGADPATGANPDVTAAAYENNDNDPNTGTTLYDIDESRRTLVRQAPPNDGVLTTIGSLGISVKSVSGFDIAGSDGTAYAAIVRPGNPNANGNADKTSLYTIDLVTGDATLVGRIGGPKPLESLTALGSLD